MAQVALPQVAQWHNVDLNTFKQEIAPLGRPAILKGLIADWPAVNQAQQSKSTLCRYLLADHLPNSINYIESLDANGRLFYNETMTGVNFKVHKGELVSALNKILAASNNKNHPAFYISSSLISQFFPHFTRDNTSDFFKSLSQPNFWVSNQVTVATHFDVPDNIACCIAGKRKFTLFPPDQIDNLYIGPLDMTPAGQPISLVDVKQPDFVKFPRYKQALQHAQVAELAPGDALYIPSLWWHNVESVDKFNMLVTYFHQSTPQHFGSGFDCLLHGLMSIRNLPTNKKMAWKAFFDHYIFNQTEQASQHIPKELHGVLGSPHPNISKTIQQVVSRNIQLYR